MASPLRTTQVQRRHESSALASSASRRKRSLAVGFASFLLAAVMYSPSSNVVVVDAFATPTVVRRSRSTTHGFTGRNTWGGVVDTPSLLRKDGGSNGRGGGSNTALNFMGSDGGFLGVGAPEVALIVLVGYFVLGPQDLYKLVKEIGKFISNIQSLGAEATKQFESTMDDQLDLTELRKAQQELNDSFSFRRSINTDEYSDAFDDTDMAVNAATGASVAGGNTTAVSAAEGDADTAMSSGKKRKKRRLVKRKKKQPVEEMDAPSEYPDLDMADAFPNGFPPSMDATDLSKSGAENDAERMRKERLARLEGTTGPEPDWFNASESDIAEEVLGQQAQQELSMGSSSSVEEQSRFSAQMTGGWNDRVMENEDALGPLAMVMERIALLEEEKRAADARLDEEFEKRGNLEDKFYLEKRAVLEEAAAEVQAAAYVDITTKDAEKEEKNGGESSDLEAVSATKFS